MDLSSKPRVGNDRHSKLRILQTADQHFKENTYSSITMTDVAVLAEVSRATLYRYYTSKEQLYSDVLVNRKRKFLSSSALPQLEGKTVGEVVSHICEQTLTLLESKNETREGQSLSLLDTSSNLPLYEEIADASVVLLEGMLKDYSIQYRSLFFSNIRHMMISSLLSIDFGRCVYSEIKEDIEGSCRLLLSDVWDMSCVTSKSLM